MHSRLIELADGIYVEVTAASGEPEEVSGRLAKKVDASLDKLVPVLNRLCAIAGQVLTSEGNGPRPDSAEVEFGIGFEGEGDLYLAKLRTSANVIIRLSIKR